MLRTRGRNQRNRASTRIVADRIEYHRQIAGVAGANAGTGTRRGQRKVGSATGHGGTANGEDRRTSILDDDVLRRARSANGLRFKQQVR